MCIPFHSDTGADGSDSRRIEEHNIYSLQQENAA